MNAQRSEVGALIDIVTKPLTGRQISIIVRCGLVVLLDGIRPPF